MIPEHEIFYLTEELTDKYGEVSSVYEFEISGVADRCDVFTSVAGATVLLGKGTIYTSSTLVVKPSMGVKIDGFEYKVKKLEKLAVEGVFHHYEIIYG